MASTNISPIRLAPEIRRALQKYHGQALKAHGLSYAVNVALASALGIPRPLTPVEKMSKASKTRWRKSRAEARAKVVKRKQAIKQPKGEKA